MSDDLGSTLRANDEINKILNALKETDKSGPYVLLEWRLDPNLQEANWVEDGCGCG